VKDLLDINQVCELTQFSKPTIYRRVKLGEFPQPEKVKKPSKRGPPANVWQKTEVVQWLKKNSKAYKEANAEMTNKPEQSIPEPAHGPMRADHVATTEKQKPRFMVHAVLAALIAGAMLLFFQTK